MDSTAGSGPVASVLIVDDSTVQRQHAVRLCRALGIARVDEAGDGQEALELLATLAVPPALMLIDLAMPRMDGIELIDELHRRGFAVPIVLVSASGDALLDTVQGMGKGVVASLCKPLAPESLRNALLGLAPALQAVPERRRAARLAFDAGMLAEAIAGGAVTPHFQPQMDMRTSTVRGVEALARWHHPSLGQIPPDQFIPVAEREGLIHALTLTILDQALAQRAAWKRAGVPLTVAVNLSPRLLAQADIIGEICAIAARHEVAPSQVVLELTEGCLVESSGPALSVLARLRLKGFGLAIDDYGTGFSSMQQLARIPFTELKVDRSFVHGAHQRNSLRVILKSALEMARHLGLATVAEGIELPEDMQLLHDFGCTSGQGWLIGRPMPGAGIPDWIETHQQRLNGLNTLKAPLAQNR